MINESTSKERELKISLIKDINNIDNLMQLGKIYNNNGLMSLARSCYLMILSNSKDDHVIQKVNSLLFTNEREIQMNQQKIEQSSSDFLDLLI